MFNLCVNVSLDDGTGPPKPKVEFKVGPLQPPPPIDEASLRAITEGESWESEEVSVQFDHRKQIEHFRLQGYNVVK